MYSVVSEVWSKCFLPNERFDGVIKSLSSTDITEDAIDEWIPNNIGFGSSYCICSQPISVYHSYINTKTNYVIIIGPECIRKIDSKVVSDTRKIERSTKRYKGDKRMCESCLKHNIPPENPTYMTKCGKCYISGRPSNRTFVNMYYRECDTCKKKSIHISSDSFVTKCRDCYSEYKSTFIPCPSCNQNNIPSENVGWMRVCVKCFKQHIDI